MAHKVRELVCVFAILSAAFAAPIAAGEGRAPSYTSAQAANGRNVYRQHCAQCHGGDLMGGESWGSGPPLAGEEFMNRWGATALRALYELMRATMPPGKTGALQAVDYINVLALILKSNAVAASDQALPESAPALDEIFIGAGAAKP